MTSTFGLGLVKNDGPPSPNGRARRKIVSFGDVVWMEPIRGSPFRCRGENRDE